MADYIFRKNFYMERIIRRLTENFKNQLSLEASSIDLDAIRQSEIPDFIADRLEMEARQRLRDSLQLPESKWANLDNDAVEAAWLELVDTAENTLRIPKEKLDDLLEDTVHTVVELLVEPRSSLPDFIYGKNHELTYDEIQQRMDSIVVYRHFATIIPRYMQKKDLDSLQKDRCVLVIRKVDERLVSNYNADDWLRLLEPWFELTGNKVHPIMLFMFFRDKDRYELSDRFDGLNHDLTREQVYEILSNSNVSAPETNEEPMVDEDISEKEAPKTATDSFAPPDEDENGKVTGQESSGSDETEEEIEVNEAVEQNDSVIKEVDESESDEDTLQSQFQIYPDKEEAEEEPDDTFNRYFSDDSADSDADDEEKEDISSQNETMGQKTPTALEQERDEETMQDADASPEESSHEIFPGAGNGNDKSEDGEEVPIWQRFMTPEELEEHRRKMAEQDEDDEREIEITEPGNQTEGGDESKESLPDIRSYLKDDQSRFVHKMFGGSEQAYEDALNLLEGCQNWKEATRQIENEVFKRNLVDMYSDIAIDFTDRLHAYFKKKSQIEQQ